jgi:tetratricopeptide (TPR) repeat protein
MSSARATLGHYEILGPIGAGGMGEVFSAKDSTLGRKVAIKMLPLRLAGERDTLSRFTQEARSASALNHPNIVTIYEVGADDGTPYIVMEYIDGRDLRTLIHAGAPPVSKILDVAAQIADGLAAAHERGIIHRDLKPENIMITRDGFVKVLDFGLAKLVNPSPDDEHTLQIDMPGTNPGTILGTVGYMSPEQATGKRLDFRSDQFAFGAILHELCTGRPAFEGENAIDTLSAILHAEPPPIVKVNPRIPIQLCDIVKRLLAKDPNDRYNSTRDLARELKMLRDRVSAEESGFHPTGATLAQNARRTRTAVVAALGLALFIAGGIWMARDRITQPATAAAKPVAQSAAAQKKYLAVLRFADLSTDKGGQLVADGIAETLTARLARVDTLQVTRARSADLEANDIEKVGRDLGANLILRGSMQRTGDRIRVSYSIYDLRTRSEMTGDTLDGTTRDLFDLQDKLAESVATSLDPRAVVTKSARLDPRVSQQRFLEALGHLRRYDDAESVDAAVDVLEELDRIGSSASIQAALGRAYLAKFTLTRDQELTRKASEYCERALSSDPQNTDVRITLGHVRLNSGRAPEAIAEFRNALQLQPNSVDAVLGLARALQTSGQLAEAEAAYKRAIALQPNYWATHNQLGVFYIVNARYPEAAALFEKVIQLVPDNLFGLNNLGAAYQQMGRYDDAIGVFSRTIEQKPSPQGYSNLGTCYFFLGRYKDAAAIYEKAVELAPNSYFYWGNLGDAYRWVPGAEPKSAEAYDRAIALAHDELKTNAKDAYVRARLAELLAKRGRARESREQIELALQNDRTDMRVVYCAAVIAAVQGRQDEAARSLGEALRLGYSKDEIRLDPEFAQLRRTDAFQRLLR